MPCSNFEPRNRLEDDDGLKFVQLKQFFGDELEPR